MDENDVHSSISSCNIGEHETPDHEDILPNDRHHNINLLHKYNRSLPKDNQSVMKTASNGRNQSSNHQTPL